jgi:DNA-binding transcriptional MerR regulator
MRYIPPTIEDIYGNEEIQKHLWEQEGDVKAAALKIGCSTSALYDYLDLNPEAKELRNRARKHFKRQKVAEYENVLNERILQRKQLATSFAAIKYYLDTHGKEEGWGQEISEKDKHEFDGELSKVLDHIHQKGIEALNEDR